MGRTRWSGTVAVRRDWLEGLGVQGAAIATVLSRGLVAAAGFWLLFSGRVGIRIPLPSLRPQLATVKMIVRIGAPVSVESSTQAMSVTVMTALVAIAGANPVAGYGIGTKITSMVWLPTVDMGMAVETVVGQNLGAKRADRAKRAVYLAAGILASAFLVVGGLFVWFAEPIIVVFVEGSNAGAVVEFGAAYLTVVAPTYAVMGVFHMMNGEFHGAGSTRLSMLIGLTSLWGMRAVAGATFLVVLGMGATGVWYGIALSNVTAALVGAFFFLRGKWTGDILGDDGGPESAESVAAEDPATSVD